jgi:hypothetical protein
MPCAGGGKTHGAHSLLIDLVTFNTAALLALYANVSTLPWKLAMLAKLMIFLISRSLDWCESHFFTHVDAITTPAVTLTLNMPAQLTRMSISWLDRT